MAKRKSDDAYIDVGNWPQAAYNAIAAPIRHIYDKGGKVTLTDEVNGMKLIMKKPKENKEPSRAKKK